MSKAYRPVFIVIAVFAVVMVIANFSRNPAGAAERIPWRHDLPSARTEAAAAHKPVLAYFTATWCGPCQEMHRSTWSDAKVEAALRDYVPVILDVDQNSKAAADFGVSAIPCYVVLDDQGKAVRRGEGYRPTDEFLDWLHSK
jgi:thiol:disulfide interchange protein